MIIEVVSSRPKECSREEESLVVLLADDTKTYQEIDDDVFQQPADQQALQSRVDRIAKWADDWRMEINSSKSKIMHVGRNNPRLPYTIN